MTWTQTAEMFERQFPNHVGRAALDLAEAHARIHGKGPRAHDDDTRLMAEIDKRGAEKYLRAQGYDAEYMRRLAAKVIKHWWKT